MSRTGLERVVGGDRPVLDAMVDAYLAELASHRERPVGPTDAASYVYLPHYWSEAGRHPFFIRGGDARIGFVLVREVLDEGVIEMSDFYLETDARRGGVGRAAVAEVWRRFPGTWRVQVHPRNVAAAAFWPSCIAAHAAGTVTPREVLEEDGHRLEYVFEITNAPAS